MLVNLHFTDTGNGVPVVFLHGFLECSTMWDYLPVDRLPFRAILIDLPGHGKSRLEDLAEPPSIDFFAEKVKKCLDDLEISRYHVVGHSMGGYVALSLKESDTRCKKAVLLNSNFWDDSEEKKRDRIRIADLAFASKELLIRHAVPGLFTHQEEFKNEIDALINEALQMTPEAIAYASLAMRDRSDKKHVVQLHANDFLFIQGVLDPLVSKELIEQKLFDLTVSVSLLRKAGHMAHIEEPQTVFAVLTNFLGENNR